MPRDLRMSLIDLPSEISLRSSVCVMPSGSASLERAVLEEETVIVTGT